MNNRNSHELNKSIKCTCQYTPQYFLVALFERLNYKVSQKRIFIYSLLALC